MVDSDDLEEVFPSSLACYAGRKIHCRGDGKRATRWPVDQEKTEHGTRWVRTGNAQTVACPCNYLNAKKGFVCKPHGTLWVTIVAGNETRLGARHSFRTTSWNSIRWIRSGLETIQRQVGTVVGMPLLMILRPHQVQTDDGQKIVYVVHVELRTKDLLALQQHAIRAAQTRQQVWSVASRPTVLGLPAPGKNESAVDQADIQQEYHPDPEAHDLPDGEPEDDNDDDLAFDPETGEVFDTVARDADTNFSDQNAEPPVDDPTPEPSDQSQTPPPATSAEHTVLPAEHEIRTRIAELITKVANARHVVDTEMERARKEIWAEAADAAGYPRLGWKDLTFHRATKIDDVLCKLVDKAKARDKEEEDASAWNDSDPNDGIPF